MHTKLLVSEQESELICAMWIIECFDSSAKWKLNSAFVTC